MQTQTVRTSQLQHTCTQRTVQRPFQVVRCALRAPARAVPLELRSSRSSTKVLALGSSGDEEKKITRETEPDNYWQTPSEAKGENPAKDPLAIIGIVGLLLPFLILGVAIATGYVDISNYRYGGH